MRATIGAPQRNRTAKDAHDHRITSSRRSRRQQTEARGRSHRHRPRLPAHVRGRVPRAAAHHPGRVRDGACRAWHPVGVPAGGRGPAEHGRRLHGGPLRGEPGHLPRRKPVLHGLRLPAGGHRAERRRPHRRGVDRLGSGVVLASRGAWHPVVHVPEGPRPADVAAPLRREPGGSDNPVPRCRSARVHDVERRAGGRLLRHSGRLGHHPVHIGAAGTPAPGRSSGASAVCSPTAPCRCC